MKFLLRLIKIAAAVLCAAVVLFAGLLGFLTVTEYRPAGTETLKAVEFGQPARAPAPGDTLKLLSWNIGYAALDATQDFVMDGGRRTRPPSLQHVLDNMEGITGFVGAGDWDAVLIQEADLRSRRSYDVNEVQMLGKAFGAKTGGTSAFAYNFNCRFVPFPVPDFIGPVQSGLVTLNHLPVVQAERISLPVPFKWPVRTANLKRCLLVERVPLAGGKELVLINLHMEAYDSSGGREAQTRELAALMNAEYEKGAYVIAGGDFNQNFPGVENNPLFAVKNDSFFAAGKLDTSQFPAGWTFACDTKTPSCRLLNEPYSGSYETTQLYAIDGFILSPNVEALSVKAAETGFRYSDHHPVTLEARLLP